MIRSDAIKEKITDTFKDLENGHFDEIMLIRNATDLDAFMEMYDVSAITKEY